MFPELKLGQQINQLLTVTKFIIKLKLYKINVDVLNSSKKLFGIVK